LKIKFAKRAKPIVKEVEILKKAFEKILINE
jgi:hypothetical protein